MNQSEIIIVGCGLSGAVIARHLAERGKKVVIWERRDHIGGNMFDYMDDHGVLVQKYGPHTFHTKEKRLYDYMCHFGEWDEYKLTCGAYIDGKFTPTPFNYQTIDDFYTSAQAADLKKRIEAEFGDRRTATVVEVLKSHDPMVRGYAQMLFDKDYSLYTAKQWGVSPSEIDVSVLNRVPLRFSYADGYFDDPYQVMPRISFTSFFETLLAHKNITVELGVEALHHIKISNNLSTLLVDGTPTTVPVVYTGALDELFGCVKGQLPYRSLRFEWKHEDIDSLQPQPVVAYPQAEGFTRITEYNKLPVQHTHGSSYAVEYPVVYDPQQGAEPYYPVLTEKSQNQHAEYVTLAKQVKHLYCCGRLADFKYYNMDQALKRALEICDQLG